MNLKKTLSILIGASMLCSTSVSAQPFDNSELEYEMVQTEKVNASSGTCGENLTWTLDNDGTLTISGTGDMTDYYIGDAPWYDNRSSIKTVIIGDGVTSIGYFAFCDCSSLTSVTIGNSVTSIGECAFGDCLSLTSITIPDSVTSIGWEAFSYCSSLTSVVIPDSVTSIGDDAFYNCSSLTDVYYTGSEEEWNNIQIESDNDHLLNATIHFNVASEDEETYIEQGKCGDDLDYTLSKDGTLTITGTGDMYNYDYDSSPFNYDDSIITVIIENGVTSIGERAFSNCSSLTSVVIPDSVTSIGYGAFSNCSSLTSVTIPYSVTSIGFYAFYCCDSLTSVTIPDSVTSIGDLAFSMCSSLTSVTIPDSVTSIGWSAFYGCSSLTSVTIGNSVTSIGEGAFYSCESLTSIIVDENNEYYSSDEYGVLFNKDKTELIQYPIGNERTTYTIPDSVTSIGEDAFYNCDSLTSVTIPDGVTSIGNYAFSSCDSLTSVTIGDSVTSLGYGAFYSCSNLTSVTIPDGVTSIGDSAFYECSSLTSVVIPDSVTSIGFYAFYYCDSLTSVTIPDGVTSIGDSAFSSCSSLTLIIIPDSVTSIGVRAFYCCSNLTSVTIGDDVTSIGMEAFSKCSSLTSVTIPDSVTSIGMYAFSYCYSLTSVTIPDSVTSIGSYAFYYCGSLTDVYYTGSEEEWNEISIGSNNEELLNANITFNYRNVICEGTRETAAKDGTFELMIGGTSFGKFTFTSVDGGFTVMNGDGEYLSLSNRKLVFGDDAGIWTYNNGRLSISTGSRFFARNYYLTASRNALTVSTSTRNTDITLLEEFSLNTHTFGDYIDNGDGTHSLICEYCGFEESESCVYGDDHKCICGAVDKAYVSLEISVEVNKTTTGSFFKRTNYVATITVDALGIDVAKVQYSTNNRRWYTGTSYSSRSNITTLYVRVTDTDGNVYDYTYKA